MFWWRSADGRTRTRGSAVNVVIELEASMRRVLAAIVLGLASTTAGLAAFADAAPVTLPMSGTPSLAPILKKITPAVVSIETKGHTAQHSKTKKLGTREIANSGSGVVYDARQGFIVTNSHVIEHAVEITVTVADGRTLKAKRIGADPDSASQSKSSSRRAAAILLVFAPTSNRKSATPTSPSSKAMTRANMALASYRRGSQRSSSATSGRRSRSGASIGNSELLFRFPA
jgi:hypothetical protein